MKRVQRFCLQAIRPSWVWEEGRDSEVSMVHQGGPLGQPGFVWSPWLGVPGVGPCRLLAPALGEQRGWEHGEAVSSSLSIFLAAPSLRFRMCSFKLPRWHWGSRRPPFSSKSTLVPELKPGGPLCCGASIWDPVSVFFQIPTA